MRIVFFCPPVSVINGGIKHIFRMAETLIAQGRDAVVFEQNGQRPSWFVSTAPLVELPGPFAIVVANIIYDTLVDLADELVRMTAIGGHLILSGILTGEQSDGLGAVYAGKGLLLQKHTQEKEWSALLFVKMEG